MFSIGQMVRVSCVILGLASIVLPAHAQVDMTGPWSTRIFIVFGPTFDCTPINFAQTGTSITITGSCPGLSAINATGTIDPFTGEFSASGTGSPGCTLAITGGEAALDQRTFFMQFQCSPGPAFGAIYGYRCGNNVIDAIAAEDCDEGDRDGGDCCNDVCQFDSPGHFCFLDGNECTAEGCDGAGTCVSTNLTGAPCNDQNQCTTPDTCTDGVCGGVARPDGSACDDYDSCTTESCVGGSCDATTKPDGAPCDDGYDCLTGETCLAGACQPGSDIVCAACKRCYEGAGCVAEDYAGHPSEDASRSTLQLKKTAIDRTKWSWTSYNAIDGTDFGDPTTTTGYEFCVFDPHTFDPVTGYGQLVFGTAIPAGSDWTKTRTGYLYRSADKRLKVRLKSGGVGKAKILVRAKGAPYGVEYLPPGDFVEARIRTLEGVTPALSFEAYYGTPITSTTSKFKAQIPQP